MSWAGTLYPQHSVNQTVWVSLPTRQLSPGFDFSVHLIPFYFNVVPKNSYVFGYFAELQLQLLLEECSCLQPYHAVTGNVLAIQEIQDWLQSLIKQRHKAGTWAVWEFKCVAIYFPRISSPHLVSSFLCTFSDTFLRPFAEGCILFLFKYSHDSKGIFHKSISHPSCAASSPTLCTFILTPATIHSLCCYMHIV